MADKKYNPASRFAGFLGKVIVMFLILFIFYGAILFYTFKKIPGAKAEVSAVYKAMLAGAFTTGTAAGAAPVPAPTRKIMWVNINERTSNQQLEAIKIDDMEIKKIEGYEDLLDGNNMKVINAIVSMLGGGLTNTALSKQDEAQMKEMIEQIKAAYEAQNKMMGELVK